MIVTARRAAIMLALLAATATAQAQAIYRCGPQGREYSDQPCKQGRVVEAAPAPTPEQRAAAQQVAAGEARRAEALRRERHDREGAAQPAAGFKTEPSAQADDPPARNKKHRPTTRQRSSRVVR